MNLKKIIYTELNSKQKENYNFLMNERASGNYSWNRLEKDKNTMFEMYKSKQ